MKNLRNQFDRFCLRNRDKGIPNLMLYIIIGSAIVYIFSMINGGAFLYDFLRFDKALILKGQVWRLFTYIFTYSPGTDAFWVLISLYFFYRLSRYVELSMGTLRYNIYYFSGVLLMDIFAMLFCPAEAVTVGGEIISPEIFSYIVYGNMAFYLHLSILLMFASTNPDSQFVILFILPVKAWFLGLVYVLLLAIDIINLAPFFPHNLFPLVGLLNYLIFAGKDVANLFPFIRPAPRRKAPPYSGSVPFRKAEPKRPDYNHRCTVCGRTDVSNPELEFRYCSRCNGYYCYCEEHISNHSHIE